MGNLENIKKSLRFIFVIMIVAVAAACINTSDVSAGSWHKKYLSPGQTYDVSDAEWNTTVYINKPGNYTLKGQSEKCKVVVQSGGVNIYLEDGLEIDPGIKANIGVETASLIIEDMDGTVKLISKKGAKAYFGGYLLAPAIEKVGYNSKLVFETEEPSNPGTITAYRSNASNSAGIGTAFRLSIPVTTGNMEFNSGNVIATGGYSSAGIGGGSNGSVYKIVINGGNVKATGGSHGTGIGGGYHGNALNITVNGGTVTAESIGEGSGIGSGEQSEYAKNITINGGNIRALSDLGAGIGGGDRSEVENLRINGGTIYAYSRDTAIGSSCDQHLGILKSLYITGGTIIAESKTIAIGAAHASPGPNNIYISGGIIEARGDQVAIGGGGFSSVTDDTRVTNVTISGGTIIADGGDEDFGGGAWLNEFNLTIIGGSVLAERNKMDSAPENQFGNEVKRTDITIDGLGNARFAVQNTGISGIPASYEIKDVYTRNAKLYFWIPDNAVVNTATLPGENVYRGKVDAGKSGTLYKDNLVHIESDDSSLAAGSGILYEGADIINDLKAPEISAGNMLTGYKVRGTDILIADKDGKLMPNVTVGSTAYTDADGKWIRNTSAMINFKAVTEENSYTVAFDSNVPGNTSSTPYPDGNMSNVTVKYTENYTVPEPEFSLKGYTFAGWNTKPDGSGESYEAGTKTNMLAASGTVILYAKWTPQNYEVTFDANGGSGTMTPQEMTYDQPETLDANEFQAPEGMRFKGWMRKDALGGTLRTDRSVVVNLCNCSVANNVAEGYTLAAQWVPEDVPVVVMTLDGKPVSGSDVELKDGTGNIQLTELKGQNGTYSAGSEIIAEGSYDVYVDGIDTGVDMKVAAGQQDSNYTALNYYSVNLDCDENLDEATLKGNQAAVLEGTVVDIAVSAQGKTGYTFRKWETAECDPEFVDSDQGNASAKIRIVEKTTLKAVSGPVEYTVEFAGNKPEDASGEIGVRMGAQSFVYDKEQKLNRNEFALKGYTFTGWNTAYDGSGQAYSDREAVKNLTSEDKGSVTLYAQWEAYSYSVVFHENGAESGKTDAMDCSYDKEYTVPECGFSKEDYHFLGWCSEIDGIGIYYHPGDKIKNIVSENGAAFVLYAIWEHDFYTVKFDGSDSTDQVPDMQVWTKEELTLSNPGFSKDGYQLTGWNTAEDGTGKSYAADEKVTDLTEKNGTVTLYAEWTPQTYELTFDANGGKGSMASQEMTYDNTVKLDANAFTAPAGKEFAGWLADDGNDQTEDVIYEDQAEVMNLCQYNDEGQLTGFVMVAQWKDSEENSTGPTSTAKPEEPANESGDDPDTGDDLPLIPIFALMISFIVMIITAAQALARRKY